MVYNSVRVMNMEKSFLAQRIAKLRLEKGISAREMSLALGMGENYINSIENQKSYPPYRMMLDICDYLGVTMSELFDEGNSVPEHHRRLYADIRRLTPAQTKLVSDLVAEIAKGGK